MSGLRRRSKLPSRMELRSVRTASSKPVILCFRSPGWEPSARTSVYLFDQGPRFKCSHNSCDDNHWKEFRARLEELNPDLPKFYFFEKEPFDQIKGFDVEETLAVTAVAENGPKPTWNELADQLDVIRIGEQEDEDAQGRTKKKKLPKHIVEERVYQFVLRAFQERSKFFFDAYPYVYLPDEETIVKFHNDDEAHTL